MNAFFQLEFDKLKNYIKQNCHSNPAKNLVNAINPLTDITKINYKLDLCTEMQNFVASRGDINFSRLEDISELLTNFLHETYNFEEFKLICNTVASSNLLAAKLETEKEDTIENESELENVLTEFGSILALPEIEKRFYQIFSSEGEVLDSASATLHGIRRRKARLRTSIIDTLKLKMSEKNFEHLVQDKLVTMRENRFVIPIKDGSANLVEGITHGRSGSKSTVFMEPKKVVGMNNELAQLNEDEKAEIFRIFCAYTDDIKAYSNPILHNYNLCINYDLLQAQSILCNSLNAEKPKIVDKPYINLKNARHPLLIKSLGSVNKVIPFDLELGQQFKILVISGPNTGGKTVTLKSIGLIALMALSGMCVPAYEDSEIGLFTQFFADIGDNQSLENALSTFSSHIQRLKELCEKGNERSLVLIDEIGSATDPEQGSALAQAILEHIAENKMVGVLTTHYTALKVFAEQNADCVNASMLFDVAKHSPTYRFKIGLPGNSFAIEVAKGLGLNQNLIERAKELAGKQNIELTELIQKLSEEKKHLARANYEFTLKTKLLEKKVEEYEQTIKKQELENKEIKKQALAKARNMVTDMQLKLEQEFEKVKKLDKQSKKQALNKTISKISSKNYELSQAHEQLETVKGQALKTAKIGDKVWVKNFDSTGIIIDIKNSKIKVDVDGFYYTTSLDNLFKAKKEKVKAPKVFVKKPAPTSAKMEINLLGNTFDEAIPKLEEFFDDAINAGLNKVRVVHGKGTGILRSKIRKWLKRQKQVNDFYAPAPEAGGEGVTIVCF